MKAPHIFYSCMFFLLTAFLLGSCKKVIHINLNAEAPRIVIEGNISNTQGPYKVKITQSVNYDQPNIFPPVTGAIVEISDDHGDKEILIESIPGTYITQNIKGTPGRTYTIKVEVGDQTYQASSYMSPPIEINSLRVDVAFDKDKRVIVNYQDPPNMANFYKAVEIVNDTTLTDISVSDDRFQDGAVINQTISNDISKRKLQSGDNITVLLQTIDKGTFEYFRTLSNILLQDGGGGPPPTAPSNPLSTFSNNALGYFSAYSQTKKMIVVP